MGAAPCDAVPHATLFGATTSGAADEGGFNGPGEPATQWVTWERSGKVSPSGAGCQLWDTPARALDRAAAAGCEVLGLSVEWARIEPSPGVVDRRALDRYAELLSMCAQRSMTPIVTLCDTAHPSWLGEEYWLTPGSPDRFADHAARVVDRLGDECARWVTVRQANLVALAGWVIGNYPPGRIGALADAWAVIDNLLTAHVLAHTAIHDRQPGAEVAMGLRMSPAYDWHRLLVDLLWARDLGVDRADLDDWIDERRILHDLAWKAAGTGERVARRAAGALSPFGGAGPRPDRPTRPFGAVLTPFGTAARARLRRPSPRRAVEALYAAPVARPLDALVVGWGRAPVGIPHGRRATPWEQRPDPGALTAWCTDQASFTPGLRLWVEDGFATRAGHRGGGRPDAWRRPAYLQAEMTAVADATAAGACVAGYLVDSLADGDHPTAPGAAFGLYGTAAEADGEVRWLHTDDAGDASASAFADLVTEVRKGAAG